MFESASGHWDAGLLVESHILDKQSVGRKSRNSYPQSAKGLENELVSMMGRNNECRPGTRIKDIFINNELLLALRTSA